MKHRSAQIDGEAVHVIDDAISPAFNQKLYRFLATSAYTQGEGTSPGTAAYKHLARDFDWERLDKSDFGQISNRVIRDSVQEPQQTYRGYCNLMLFGHLGGLHRDCSVGWNDISVVWFVCEEWQANWGGELHLFDGAGDTQMAIAPRPGRLVLFRGRTQHSATAPSVMCTRPRFSIALKCRDFTQNVEAQLEVYSTAYSLSETSGEVRARAVYMIGLLDHPQASRRLTEIAASPNAPVACRAQALKMLLRRDPTWRPRIVELLQDPSGQVRVAAAQALAPASSEMCGELEARLGVERDSCVRDAILTAMLTSSQDIDSVCDSPAT